MTRKTRLCVSAMAVLAAVWGCAAAADPETGIPPAFFAGEESGETAPEEFRRTEPPVIDTVPSPAEATPIPPAGEQPESTGPAPASSVQQPARKPTPKDEKPPAYWSEFQEAWTDAGETDAAADANANGQPRPLESNPVLLFLKMLMWLAVACAVIVLGGYAFRKWGKRTPLLAGASLGTVLGRLHLSPKATLFFVRTGGQVLVVGTTQNHIGLLAQLPAEAFAEGGPADTPREITREEAGSFLEYLRRTEKSRQESPDDEVTSLQGDIQRLQEYLRETGREPKHG